MTYYDSSELDEIRNVILNQMGQVEKRMVADLLRHIEAKLKEEYWVADDEEFKMELRGALGCISIIRRELFGQ